MSQQAGWYDDPQDDSNLRYWDGVQWTEHTSPRQKPGLDRAGQGQQQGWGQEPHGQGQGSQQQGQDGQQQGQSPYGQSSTNPYGQQSQNPYGQQQPGYNPYAGQTGQNPYQGQWGGAPMPGMGYQAQVDPRTATPDGQPLAGWWHRVGARIIDGLIMLPVTAVVGFVFMGDFFTEYMNWAMSQTDPLAPVPAELARDLMVFTGLLALTGLIYEVVLTTLAGGTLGKLATGLRIRLRDEPGKIGWVPSLLRALVYQGPNLVSGLSQMLSFLGLFSLVNVLWPLWDSKRQALHDKVAKTNVVRHR